MSLKTWVVGICLVVSSMDPVVDKADACSAFLLSHKGKHYVGKSYDWDIGVGHVVFNKRGIAKQALVSDTKQIPARWVSKHASLTFNQYGRELPNSGINAAGLVVEALWLNKSRFPPKDSRPIVNELQWIQYQLDRFASVDEMVKNADKTRIHRDYGKIHYFACDQTGECASFELLDGKMVIQHGKSMPVPTLTNNTYAESIRFLKTHRGFGGKVALPTKRDSLSRFVRASHFARIGDNKEDAIIESFAALDKVRAGKYTKWNLVYDIKGRKVYFRTLKSSAIKHVDLTGFDPSCRTPAQWLDMNADLKGSVNRHFQDYSVQANQKLISKSLGDIRAHLPPGVLEQVSRYPQMLPCQMDSR